MLLVLKINFLFLFCDEDDADAEGVVIGADGVRFESIEVSRECELCLLLDFSFILDFCLDLIICWCFRLYVNLGFREMDG